MWAAGMANRAARKAAPWALGAAGVIGAGGLLGMVNPRQSTVSGMGFVGGQMASGVFSGGLIGAAAGGIRKGASMGRWGIRGGLIGAGIGATSGLFRAGLSANRPINPISSVRATNARLRRSRY